MKKWFFTGGIIGAVALAALVFFLNKSPASQSEQKVAAASEDSASDDFAFRQFDGDRRAGGEQGSADEQGDIAVEKMRKIESFVANSRLSDEFKFLDEQMAAQEAMFQNSGHPESPEDKAALDEIKAKLSSEALMAGYKKVIAENFSDAEIEQLNEAYKDPALARLKEAEAYNRTPEGLKELAEHAKTFNPKKLDPARLEAIQEYVRASGAAENMGKVFDSVETLAGDAAPQSNKTKGIQNAMQKSIIDALVAVGDKMFQGQSHEQIAEVTSRLNNPVLKKENELKTGFMINVMQDAIGPKLAEALAKGAARN